MKCLITIVFLVLFILSCEAPHDNPLDPQNADYRYGRISGVVRTVSLPVIPVTHSNVSWPSASEETETGAQGEFDMLIYQPKDGWLLFSHPDFYPDSVYISWADTKEKEIDGYLNALPHLDSLSVYSVVLNRHPSLQKEQLIIEAFVSDRDNDIDSVQVFFFNTTNGFHLPYNTTEKSFRSEFSILDLGVFSLEDYVGQPVAIGVRDINSHFILVGEAQLIRVIYDQVFLISPTGNEITGSTPALTWQRFEPGFDFYYDVEIYTNELAPQLVWSAKELTVDQSEIIVDSELTDGSYFWVVWAIDIFGNRTRSKLSAFTVQAGM